MLNSPDPQTKEDLKQKMESVSEQIDISKNDFMSATGNIKENLNNETEMIPGRSERPKVESLIYPAKG